MRHVDKEVLLEPLSFNEDKISFGVVEMSSGDHEIHLQSKAPENLLTEDRRVLGKLIPDRDDIISSEGGFELSSWGIRCFGCLDWLSFTPRPHLVYQTLVFLSDKFPFHLQGW